MNYVRWAGATAALVVGGLVVAASLWPAPLVLSERLAAGWIALTIGFSLIATICALQRLSDSRSRNSGPALIGHGLVLTGVAVLALVSFVSLTSTSLEPGWPLTIALIGKWTSVATLLGGALLGVLGKTKESS